MEEKKPVETGAIKAPKPGSREGIRVRGSDEMEHFPPTTDKRKAFTVSIPAPEMSVEEYIERQEAVIRSYRLMIWVSGIGCFAAGLGAGLILGLFLFLGLK